MDGLVLRGWICPELGGLGPTGCRASGLLFLVLSMARSISCAGVAMWRPAGALVVRCPRDCRASEHSRASSGGRTGGAVGREAGRSGSARALGLSSGGWAVGRSDGRSHGRLGLGGACLAEEAILAPPLVRRIWPPLEFRPLVGSQYGGGLVDGDSGATSAQLCELANSALISTDPGWGASASSVAMPTNFGRNCPILERIRSDPRLMFQNWHEF